MAKYTRLEFARLCGMQPREMSVYVSRKKMIVGDDGTIDDAVPLNSVFLSTRQAKMARKSGGEQQKWLPPAEKSQNIVDLEQLTLERLQQQVEKLKNENRKLKLTNEKTVGAFMRVEHCELLIIQLSEAVHLAWENEFEDVLTRWGGKFGLSREEITEMKTQKVATSNLSRERAIKEAKKMLRRLQHETASKRGVGEHG